MSYLQDCVCIQIVCTKWIVVLHMCSLHRVTLPNGRWKQHMTRTVYYKTVPWLSPKHKERNESCFIYTIKYDYFYPICKSSNFYNEIYISCLILFCFIKTCSCQKTTTGVFDMIRTHAWRATIVLWCFEPAHHCVAMHLILYLIQCWVTSKA